VDLRSEQKRWEQIGREDPFWGVLSWVGKENGRWNREEFYERGESDITHFLDELRVLGVEPETGDALDFGCGVGRLSKSLATRFDNVTGVDISASMVEQANRIVAARYPNCEFLVSNSRSLPFRDAAFDFVVSNIVLQHMPAKLALTYIAEFLRVLRARGVAIFQLPAENVLGSQSRNPLVRWLMNALPSQLREAILRRRGQEVARHIPMYGIPRRKVVRAAERSGGRVVACIEDQAAGPHWRSFHYIVVTDV